LNRRRKLLITGSAVAAVAATAFVAPAVASASDASPSGMVTPHLVGGHPATEQYPWIASMQISYDGDPNFHNCTASLIAPQWIRVNAHCVTNQDGSAIDPAQWDLHVRVGSTDRTSGGYTANVTKIIVMPGWDWGQLDAAGRVDDLALLKLDSYLPVQPLDTWTRDLPPGAHVRQLGWGRMDPSNTGPAPVALQELDTTIDHPGACDTNPDFPMGRGEFCVTNADGTDGACGGDSGGPVVFEHDGRWEELGGTSRSPGMVPGCGGEPDIYTDTTYYRPWEYALMRGEDPVAAEKYLPGPIVPLTMHPGPAPVPVAALRPYYDLFATTTANSAAGSTPVATATHGPGPQ
jgi:secreted trypsin-like serine protease